MTSYDLLSSEQLLAVHHRTMEDVRDCVDRSERLMCGAQKLMEQSQRLLKYAPAKPIFRSPTHPIALASHDILRRSL
jgi:hypothetical protein